MDLSNQESNTNADAYKYKGKPMCSFLSSWYRPFKYLISPLVKSFSHTKRTTCLEIDFVYLLNFVKSWVLEVFHKLLNSTLNINFCRVPWSPYIHKSLARKSCLQKLQIDQERKLLTSLNKSREQLQDQSYNIDIIFRLVEECLENVSKSVLVGDSAKTTIAGSINLSDFSKHT